MREVKLITTGVIIFLFFVSLHFVLLWIWYAMHKQLFVVVIKLAVVNCCHSRQSLSSNGGPKVETLCCEMCVRMQLWSI